jgi:uncharacterized protein (TIRG00374 family)
MPEGAGHRGRIGAALRLLLAAALLAWLLSRVNLADVRAALGGAAARWPWALAGLALALAALLASQLRWMVILRAEALPVSFGAAFSIFFTGQFFNAFLLGACGGDLARAWLIAVRHPGRRAAAAASVFADRAIGLAVMLVLSAALLAFRLSAVTAHAGGRRAVGSLVVLLAAAAAGIGLFARNVFERWPWLARLEARWSAVRPVRRLYEALYVYRGRARLLPPTIFCSALVLLCVTASAACLGEALGMEASPLDYLVFIPLINIGTAMPLTPGGIGVREALFTGLFAAVGVPPHLAILLSLSVTLVNLVWSAAGGVVFLAATGAATRRDLLRARMENGAASA